MAYDLYKQRKHWLDITKGIGIILVICGHLFTYGGEIWCRIFAFHMPLFFFCSGITYKAGDTDFKSFFCKKAKGLLVPYIVVLLIGMTITVMIPSWRSQITTNQIKNAIWNAQPEVFHVGQIWFLICLFIVYCLFYILYLVINDDTTTWLLTIVVASFIITHLNYLPFGTRLPFKLDTALYGIVFFIMGFLYNMHDAVINNRFSEYIISIIALGAFILYGNGPVNICEVSYGYDYTAFLFYALSGIAVTIIISKAIRENSFLEYVGRHSLFIFTIHSFALYAYEKVLSLIHGKSIVHMSNMSDMDALLGGAIITASMAVLCVMYYKVKNTIKVRI